MTRTYPLLARAPIHEAVVHLQFDRQVEPAAFREPKAMFADYDDDAKSIDRIAAFRTHVAVSGAETHAETQQEGQVGWRVRVNEGDTTPWVALLQQEGVTTSRLRPYTHWDELRDQARSNWERVIRDIDAEVGVSRIGVRFINVMHSTLPVGEIMQRLTLAPQMPEGWSGQIAPLFQRFEYAEEGDACRVAVMQSLECVEGDASRWRLIADIDASASGAWDVASEDIWKLCEHLRELKNDMFFQGFTADEEWWDDD